MFDLRSIIYFFIAFFICISCAANVPTYEMINISKSENSEGFNDSLDKVDEIKTIESSKPLEKPTTIYDVLAVNEDVAQEIFDCLEFKDYAKLRLVSSPFRKFHDDSLIRIPCNIFPGFPGFLFEHYYAHETLAAHLKHRLAPLVKALIDIDPPIQIELTELNSREIALRLNEFYVFFNEDGGLKLANFFLNVKVLSLNENYNWWFLRNSSRISRACTLGLTTLVRQLSIHYANDFIKAVGSTGETLYETLRCKKYEIFQFIIRFLRSRFHQFDDKIYLYNVIHQLIEAKRWNLLQETCELIPNYDDFLNLDTLKQLAAKGTIEVLVVMKNLSRIHRHLKDVACVAAEQGHLAFLEKMDALELLRKSCYLAIHAAASNGQTECLEFLVSRLGTKYLGYTGDHGIMPIHLAAGVDNPETLRAIIRLYPYCKWGAYECFSLDSPLHDAVYRNLVDNARIILEHFPELINFYDSRNYTVIHSAMYLDDNRMLRLLLEYAPPGVITARTNAGNCALHKGYSAMKNVINYIEKLELLMNTGHFTGMERNFDGITPIHVVWETQSISQEKLMEIFKLDTEEDLEDALEIVKDYY